MQKLIESIGGLFILATIVGLIKPSLIIKVKGKEPSRKNILKFLGIPSLILIILVGVLYPDPVEDINPKTNQEITKKEKKKNELSDKDPQDMIEDVIFEGNIKHASTYFIEEYEKQKVKKVSIRNLGVYSNDPVKDKAGTEIKYSFLATGRYEEKGTGALKDFAIALGYKDDDNLNKGNALCIQYFNGDTGTQFNAMSEEDDVFLKLEEALYD